MISFLNSSETGTTTQPFQGSTWQAEAYQRALALKDLPHDWNGPRSTIPTIAAIHVAMWYIQRAAELELFDLGAPFISPMYDGGVQLEWDHGQRQLEIELDPAGDAQFLTSEAGNVKVLPSPEQPSPDVDSLFGWLAANP